MKLEKEKRGKNMPNEQNQLKDFVKQTKIKKKATVKEQFSAFAKNYTYLVILAAVLLLYLLGGITAMIINGKPYWSQIPLLIIIGLFVSVMINAILVILYFIYCEVKKFKNVRMLSYLPLTKEELDEMGIKNFTQLANMLDDVFFYKPFNHKEMIKVPDQLIHKMTATYTSIFPDEYKQIVRYFRELETLQST